MAQLYRLVHETRDGKRTLKGGLTLEKAERLQELAKVDPRTCLRVILLEAEPATEPATAPVAAKKAPVFDQDARNFRGQTEEYSFTLLDPGRYICETAKGNGYLVSAECCSCPDHEWRASKVNGICKHRHALHRHLFVNEGRDLQREAQVLRQAEFAARMAAEREAMRATYTMTDAQVDRLMGVR